MAVRQEPWLVYSHGKKNRFQTFYCPSGRSYHVSHIPEMRHRIIHAHSHGWLVLVHPSTSDTQGHEFSLYNPSTAEKIELPNWPPGYDPYYSYCALSSDPKVEGSIVMFIHQDSDEPWFLSCKLDGEDVCWVKSTVEGGDNCISCGDRIVGYQAVASLGGEFHVLTGCCESLFKVQFNQLDDEDKADGFTQSKIRLLDTKVRRPNRPETHFVRDTADNTHFLVQLPARPNELMIVEVDYGDHITDDDDAKDIGFKGVEFYMANFQEGRWEDLEDLPDDCAIFLGSHPDNILSYKIPKEDLDAGIFRGNTVYFTQNKEINHLYAYDVRERSISVWSHGPNMKHDCSEPKWIMRPRDDEDRKISTSGSGDQETASEKEMIMLREGSGNMGNPWCDIPMELLSVVQSRLFGADRCYFRLACKTWQSSFSSTSTLESHDDHQFAKWRSHRFPILIHLGKDGELVHLYNPITNSTTTKSLPGLKGAVIRSSRHGWLLLSQGSFGANMFFLNPFTDERIDLPNQRAYEFEGITFSSPPTSSDCIVLGYSVSPILVMFRSVYRGERKWTDSSERRDGIQFDNSFSNPVYHQGLFYIMGKTGNLFTHDARARTEKSMTSLSNLPSKPCASIRRSHLMECNGKLLSVFTGNMGKFLQVYELHQEETMTWKKVKSLEDKVLFLSSASLVSSTSSEMETSSLGNKVFLDRFNEEHGVFHSLATRMFYTLWSGYKSDDWCDTKEYVNCAWIEPNFETHTEDELRWA